MASIFDNIRTMSDYQRAEEEFQLKKQEALAKMEADKFKMQNPNAGQNSPAALQLANEYRRRIESGDLEGANTLAQFAKTVDRGVITSPDGGYISAPGYDQLLAQRKGLVSGADEGAKQIQKNIYEPNREGLKKTEEENAIIAAMEPKKREEKRIETGIAEAETAPLLDDLLKLNAGTIDAPYAAAFQPFLKAAGSDKATNLDLMKQARLELAAPLAKQLGVNPTDKDFQASLDRIFDINATQPSREAQIKALQRRVGGRANMYSSKEVIPSGGSVIPPKFDPTRVPMKAAQALKANPELAADFDAKYGQGASKFVLGK